MSRTRLHLSPETRRWLQLEAAERHGGDIGAVITATLEAAYSARQAPDDPWQPLQVSSGARRLPRHRIPVADLLAFLDAWDATTNGGRRLQNALYAALGIDPATRESPTRGTPGTPPPPIG
jgi:hypothetical protein